MGKGNPIDNSLAQQFFCQALDADRSFACAHFDPNDVEAQAIVALARFNVDGDDRGLATLSEALQRNPNAAWAHGVKGMLFVQVVRYSEGREAVRAAECLNPRDPSAALFPAHLAISYYFERNYPCAVATARNALARYTLLTRLFGISWGR